MVEFLFLRDIDAKMRELVGLYHAEKRRADELEQELKKLKNATEGGKPYDVSRTILTPETPKKRKNTPVSAKSEAS